MIEEEKAKKFIEEVIKLSKEYGFSIEHEDCHGAFEIRKYNEDASDWLRYAHIL